MISQKLERDEVLKTMLNTSPKPNKSMTKKEKKLKELEKLSASLFEDELGDGSSEHYED